MRHLIYMIDCKNPPVLQDFYLLKNLKELSETEHFNRVIFNTDINFSSSKRYCINNKIPYEMIPEENPINSALYIWNYLKDKEKRETLAYVSDIGLGEIIDSLKEKFEIKKIDLNDFDS